MKSQPVGENAWVISPQGVLDASTSGQLSNRIQKLFDEAKEPSHFLLDMAQVKYISSVGLGTLISFVKRSKEKNMTFALYDTQLPVQRVLEISRLDFLLVKPESLEAENPFAEYIRSQEIERKKP